MSTWTIVGSLFFVALVAGLYVALAMPVKASSSVTSMRGRGAGLPLVSDPVPYPLGIRTTAVFGGTTLTLR